MSTEILVNISHSETRAALVEGGAVQEVFVQRPERHGLVGNIYKGRVQRVLPGMQAMATSMMKAKMKKKGVASLTELRDLCLEAEVKFIACQMTVDLFDFDKSDFIDGIEYGGAAMFMKFAGETDVCLFI